MYYITDEEKYMPNEYYMCILHMYICLNQDGDVACKLRTFYFWLTLSILQAANGKRVL
jgi:hypothetical protein